MAEQTLCSQETWYAEAGKWCFLYFLYCFVQERAPSQALLLSSMKDQGPGDLCFAKCSCLRGTEKWSEFFCAKKCKSLLFGENTVQPNCPLHHGRCFLFLLYQQKYKILAAPQAPWGWGRRMLLAGSCVQHAVLYAFNTSRRACFIYFLQLVWAPILATSIVFLLILKALFLLWQTIISSSLCIEIRWRCSFSLPLS